MFLSNPRLSVVSGMEKKLPKSEIRNCNLGILCINLEVYNTITSYDVILYNINEVDISN